LKKAVKQEERGVEVEVMKWLLLRRIVHQEGRRVGGRVVVGEMKADIGLWTPWLTEAWLEDRRGRVVVGVVDDDHEMMWDD
jgi:hypothetical protein